MSSSEIENIHNGTSTRSLELANNTKPNKKLSFSVDSLLTSKKRSINPRNVVKHEGDLKLADEERAEEEEDLEVDGNEGSDLDDDIKGQHEEDNITIDEEREAKLRIDSAYNTSEISNRDEGLANRIAI